MFRFTRRRNFTDFRRTFSEFSKSLTLIVDLEQLKDNVISKIGEISREDIIYIFLLNHDLNTIELAETRGTNIQYPGKYVFPIDGRLIQWFSINKTSLVIKKNPEIFSYFSEQEKSIIENLGIDVIFPLLVMNRISGLVCIGDRTGGGKYSPEEIEILNTFLDQAAFAFENAYLYQQQKSRLIKMYRADRLATLGQLAAGAAHEIRNPLTSIRSTIQYIYKDLKNTSRGELISGLLEEVDRINEIIEGLLSFAKPSAPKNEKIDLRTLIEDTIALVEKTADKQRVEITLFYNCAETALIADPSQLKQVFLNIIMNALQAMESGGNLDIAVDIASSERYADTERFFYNIRFKDTGTGIPKENIENIYEPFFTTKKEGTGLGLSISYGIIHHHGGDIEIMSRFDDGIAKSHGTIVTVTLPSKR